MPNWPVTTTSITEGTIIKASDLENNFNVLKNAANTLHERFSTLSFSCPISVVLPEGHAGNATVIRGLSTYIYNASGNAGADYDGYTAFGVFQVPSWCQAVRVRTMDVLNSTVLPYTDSPAIEIADNATPLEVGARFVSAISAWDQNAGSAPGTAISSMTFPVSGDFAKGYSGSSSTYPVVKQAAPGTLVLGGQYIVVYGRGALEFTCGAGEALHPLHFRFHVNLMCDAMVPIP